MDYKVIYLVDFALNANDLRTLKFDSEYAASGYAQNLARTFTRDEYHLLQVRIRYDKAEEEE